MGDGAEVWDVVVVALVVVVAVVAATKIQKKLSKQMNLYSALFQHIWAMHGGVIDDDNSTHFPSEKT